MHQKLALDPFLILLNNLKQPLHARNYFINKVFWKRIIKKPEISLLYFFFQTQSLLMGNFIKNKRGLELVISCSSGYKTSSGKFYTIYYTISYILSDQVSWCNVKWFLSYSKNTFANLCKSIYDIINYSASICPFESGKCGKKGKKLEKIEYIENEKSFLDEIKNIFHSF